MHVYCIGQLSFIHNVIEWFKNILAELELSIFTKKQIHSGKLI